MKHFFPSSRRRQGAALIEFAMISTVFLLMLLGLIQFGIYQSTTNTLWNLSREGARYASVGNPTDDQITNHIYEFAPPNIVDNKLTVVVTPKTRVSGEAVEVRLTYDMTDKILFPDPGGVLDNNLLKKSYSTVSTMRKE